MNIFGNIPYAILWSVLENHKTVIVVWKFFSVNIALKNVSFMIEISLDFTIVNSDHLCETSGLKQKKFGSPFLRHICIWNLS